jgi:hypothetical protein
MIRDPRDEMPFVSEGGRQPNPSQRDVGLAVDPYPGGNAVASGTTEGRWTPTGSQVRCD